jgi:hypothetical protein
MFHDQPPIKTAPVRTIETSVGDPHLWLMNPDPDPTPFFSDFNEQKNNFLSFFSINFSADTYFSKILC